MKDIIDVQIDKRIIIGFGVVLGTLLVGWIAVSMYRDTIQTNDFVEREIGGIIIQTKDIAHGKYAVTIKQYKTGEELSYYLRVSKFFRENSIHAGDSIAKEANGRTIDFYKKDKGTFYKCCDLYY